MWWPLLHIEVQREFRQPTMWETLKIRLWVDGWRPGTSTTRRAELARLNRKTKRNETVPCPGCGKQFDRRPNGWLRAYCSDKCRRDFNNKKLTEKRRAEREHAVRG